MEKAGKRSSMARLFAELIEAAITLAFLETNRALSEVRKRVRSAEKGTVMVVLGALLLLLALVTFIGTAVAALAVLLPVWLSALIVALTLTFSGVASLFSGLGNLRAFSLIPTETLLRVRHTVQNLTMAAVHPKGASERKGAKGGTTSERRSAVERRTVYDRRTVSLGELAAERRSASERRTAFRVRRGKGTTRRTERSELKQKAA